MGFGEAEIEVGSARDARARESGVHKWLQITTVAIMIGLTRQLGSIVIAGSCLAV